MLCFWPCSLSPRFPIPSMSSWSSRRSRPLLSWTQSSPPVQSPSPKMQLGPLLFLSLWGLDWRFFVIWMDVAWRWIPFAAAIRFAYSRMSMVNHRNWYVPRDGIGIPRQLALQTRPKQICSLFFWPIGSTFFRDLIRSSEEGIRFRYCKMLLASIAVSIRLMSSGWVASYSLSSALNLTIWLLAYRIANSGRCSPGVSMSGKTSASSNSTLTWLAMIFSSLWASYSSSSTRITSLEDMGTFGTGIFEGGSKSTNRSVTAK